MAHGRIHSEQIDPLHRQGDGEKFLMFGGGPWDAGDALVLDADGNAVSGAAGGGSFILRFALAVGSTDAEVANGLGNPRIVDELPAGATATLAKITACAGVAAVGANLRIRLNKNGVTQFSVEIPAGTTATQEQDPPAGGPFNTQRLDQWIPDITQIGATTPGRRISVNLHFTY